jgi:hypothetical protein
MRDFPKPQIIGNGTGGNEDGVVMRESGPNDNGPFEPLPAIPNDFQNSESD